MKNTTFTPADVNAISKLAHIPVSQEEKKDLAAGFTKVIGVLDTLKNGDVSGVEPTNHATGLENVLREDEVDVTRMFSQAQALQNAKRTHNGFFVVDQVLAQE